MRAVNMKSLKEMGYQREDVMSFYPDVSSSHLCNHCPVKIDDEMAKKVLADIYDSYQ